MLSTLKNIPSKMKHKKLSENWFEAKPVVIEGMNFRSKYIGMTLVDSSKGEEMAGAAIKRIVTASKVNHKDLALVILTVSPRGIKVKNASTNELIEDIDISRISFCTADKVIGKVFGYVIKSSKTESFECHAYMCGSRKEAQRLALTVAQSFTIAYEFSSDKSESSENSPPTDVTPSTSTSSGFSFDNKKLSNIYHSISDSRYKRLSDSFSSGNEPAVPEASASNESDVNEQTSVLGLDNQNDAPVLSSSLPTQQATYIPPSRKKSDDVIVSILPPPNSKGKQQAGRTRRTPTIDFFDLSSAFVSNSKPSATEAAEVEFDFAELALSRTKDSA